MATSRRTAILAEAFRPEKATPFFSKDARIRDLLCDALNEAKDPLRSYLEELDWAHFNMLIDAFRPHEVPAGACIIKQGQLVEDFKPGLFVLEAGELEAWKADPSGLKEARVQTYRQPGCVFGELAVLHQAPRAASVDAVKDSKIWSVSRQTVVKTTRSFQEARRRYYDSKLQMVELLQPLGKEQRQQVIECLRSRDYKAGDMIIREGDEGHEFFLLFDGRASAIQDGFIVKRYEPGNHFGELALLSARPRAASVVADTDCALAVLSESDFRRLLGPLDALHNPTRTRAASRSFSRDSEAFGDRSPDSSPDCRASLAGRRATRDMGFDMPRRSYGGYAGRSSAHF